MGPIKKLVFGIALFVLLSSTAAHAGPIGHWKHRLYKDANGAPGEEITDVSIEVGQSFFLELIPVDYDPRRGGLYWGGVSINWDPEVLESLDRPFNPQGSNLLISPDLPMMSIGELKPDEGRIESLCSGSASAIGSGNALKTTVGMESWFSLLRFRALKPSPASFITLSDGGPNCGFALRPGPSSYSPSRILFEPISISVVDECVNCHCTDSDDKNALTRGTLTTNHPGWASETKDQCYKLGGGTRQRVMEKVDSCSGMSCYTAEYYCKDSRPAVALSPRASNTLDHYVCSNGTVDSTPPVVSFANLSDGQTISGTIRVIADASDNEKVRDVTLKFIGKEWDHSGYSSYPHYYWDVPTRLLPNGLNQLSLIASDWRENETIASITVNVNNPEGPYCTDSDGGDILDVAGVMTNTYPGYEKTGEDTCRSSHPDDGQQSVSSCSGINCLIREYGCYGEPSYGRVSLCQSCSNGSCTVPVDGSVHLSAEAPPGLPTVEFLSPEPGDALSHSFTVRVRVGEDRHINDMRLYLDGVPVSEMHYDRTDRREYWKVLDSRQFAPGQRMLTAKATDVFGKVGTRDLNIVIADLGHWPRGQIDSQTPTFRWPRCHHHTDWLELRIYRDGHYRRHVMFDGATTEWKLPDDEALPPGRYSWQIDYVNTTSSSQVTPARGHFTSPEMSFTVKDPNAPTSTLTNPNNRYDVNNDGSVNPLDGLFILNELERLYSDSVSAQQSTATSQAYYDVSGDGQVTTLDVLWIFDYLVSNGG